MANNFDYTLDIPFATNSPSVDQPNMFQNTNSISLLISVDHVGFNTNGSGIHKQVTLLNEAAPGLGDGNGVLYANIINGNSWPIWQNATGSTALMSQASLAAANGYVSLPAGILMQWGSIVGAPIANGQAVGFPINFPNAVFSITIGPESNSTNDKTISITTGSVGVGGFTVKTSGTSSFQTLYWMAIGN